MINIVINLFGGQAYEITDRYTAPRSSSAQRYRSDPWYTSSLIQRFPLELHDWLRLMEKVRRRPLEIFGSHPADVYDAVTDAVMRGELAIYKLPQLNATNCVRGNNAKNTGLCFVRGPAPHCATKLKPEPTASIEAAKALLDEIGISEKLFLRELAHKGLYNSYQQREPIQTALKMLANGEILAYKIPMPPMAKPPKPVEYEDTSGPGFSPVPIGPETQPALSKTESTLGARKGVEPKSLDDAANRLNSMNSEIADNGHIPKYSDRELTQQAQAGEVANERYHVRFMEVDYQWDRNDSIRDENNLTGKLGREFSGATGAGPRYWSTTFDQIEDADTDAKLICQKLGLDYNPKKKYMLAIIDTDKSKQLTGCESVAATFDNISGFANRELPDEFPKVFTDEVMNTEFQAGYKQHYLKARNGFLDSDWSTNQKDFSDYLSTTNLSGNEKRKLLKRMDMQDQIGNNQHYLGNGLTDNKIAESPNKFGAVETHNFERAPTNIQKLKDSGAIKIIYL